MHWTITAAICIPVAVYLIAAAVGFARGVRSHRIPGQVAVRPVRWKVLGEASGERTVRHVWASSEAEACQLAVDHGLDSIESASITPA